MRSLCLVVVMFSLLFGESTIPDNYLGLKFGSSEKALKKAYPISEKHRFVLSRQTPAEDSTLSVFALTQKKGLIDSAKFFFVHNQLAMVVEFYFPGADIRKRVFDQVTGKYGAFVGSKNYSWRRRKNFQMLLTYQPRSKMTRITYMDTALARQISELTVAVSAIDRELKVLKTALDSLPEK